jgi:hypothetical protein
VTNTPRRHHARVGNVWVVGVPEVWIGPVIAHWDGQRWDQVPPPTRGELFALDALDAGHLWAVGRNGSSTLVLDAPSATQGGLVGTTNATGAYVSWFGSSSGTVDATTYLQVGVGGLTAGSYTMVANLPFCTPVLQTVTVTAGVIKRQDLPIHC